jgi:hypothetical protein
MYATVADLRAEGVSHAMASDPRIEALLADARAFVDTATGWFFEPRARTFRLDGRGNATIELPVPPIRIDTLSIDGHPLSLAPDDLLVEGAPVVPGFIAPRLTLRRCRRFRRETGNVTVAGLWGYTEADGTVEGRTPAAIRLVTMQLVLRALPVLVDGDAWESARQRWRLLEERTREQSYKFGPRTLATFLTGDPEIDAVLLRYRRPQGLGAA